MIDAYRESARVGAGEVVDLDFRVDHELKEKLFATRAFTRWSDGASPLMLLIDSLDGHPLGGD